MCVVVQVNGHLDYMRQMDTILVAVGVPTKDHQGASIALPQPVTPAEGNAETSDRPPSEDQQREEGLPGDGWDIPDISDLLDSLEESDAATLAASGTDALAETADEDKATAVPNRAEDDDDAESGHVSWSWEETNWTMELSNKKKDQQKHPKL